MDETEYDTKNYADRRDNCLSARIIKVFIFPSGPIFHAMNFGEKKNSIWIKSDFLMKSLKPENPILLRSTRVADHIIDVLRFVT